MGFAVETMMKTEANPLPEPWHPRTTWTCYGTGKDSVTHRSTKAKYYCIVIHDGDQDYCQSY